MFGHKDDNSPTHSTDDDNEPTTAVADNVDQAQPARSEDSETADNNTAANPPAEELATASDNQNWQHPGMPIESAATAPELEGDSFGMTEPIRDVISPAGGYPSSPNTRITTSGPVISYTPDNNDSSDDLVAATPAVAANDAELIEIRKKALDELSPLLDKLDLPAEEKFRTIMMMVQASDDESLVKLAYQAAHSIEDEKVRAQALLDIVNEINYFTQPDNSDNSLQT